MIAVFGQLMLWGAWLASFALVLCAGMGMRFGKVYLTALGRPLAWLQVGCVLTAMLTLMMAFLTKDFHLLYVANNASELLPWVYRLTASWGAHEGSLLLWVSLLNLWMAFYLAQYNQYDKARFYYTVIILGAISLGFLSLLLFTSTPFAYSETVLPARDLNPLLQDPGLVSHPPMLYMGYVGYALVFAMTMSALWEGKIDRAWARQLRPWAMMAWGCLTLGITLGSLWAYRELGWGGYWFWDPVENASLMPWLAGTAFIHVILLVEKQDMGQAWLVFLAILAFALSILGTFLVRSGVIVSVHSFASDPSRGIVLLVLLALILLCGSIVYGLKSDQIQAKPLSFAFFSRPCAILLQSLCMMVLLGSVMIGTLYPMLLSILQVADISVGAPYFEAIWQPMGYVILLLAGWMIGFDWAGKDKPKVLLQCALFVYCAAWAYAALWYFEFAFKWAAFAGITLAFYLIGGTKLHMLKLRHQPLKQLPWASWLAHLGLAVMAVGITMSGTYNTRLEALMRTGDRLSLSGYLFEFIETYGIPGPNYSGVGATFHVYNALGERVAVMHPEKRVYLVGETVMTDAAIDAGVTRDLYLALGQPEDENTWSVRLYVKPFVRWIWAGGFIMTLAALLSLGLRRRR